VINSIAMDLMDACGPWARHYPRGQAEMGSSRRFVDMTM
jgi:hypothetical protein